MAFYEVGWTCPVVGTRKKRVFHRRKEVDQFLDLPRQEPLKEVEVKGHAG